MRSLPVLYSFRRCPYAIRARMAIVCANIAVDIHEVSLKNKPAEMLIASPKATVPVLCLNDRVIVESLDIMLWALGVNDPEAWLCDCDDRQKQEIRDLIVENDSDFKMCLDKYKYSSRFPEFSEDYYRQLCNPFLSKLEERLSKSRYLISEHKSLADIAIFPFVRQFAMVNQSKFNQSGYVALQMWLDSLTASSLFLEVMRKQS